MINLRALNIRCQDDNWNDQSTATEDGLVSWLHHRLPSTCTLTRNKLDFSQKYGSRHRSKKRIISLVY
jgi:hypothetical protein